MPLPLTVSCFSKIQIGFTCLVPAHLGSPGKKAVKRVCVLCVCVCGIIICYYLIRLAIPVADSPNITILLLLLLHPCNGLFSRTTWVSRYHKGKTSLDLNDARDDGVWGGSGISWTICKQSARRSRQITTETPHHSILQAGCSSRRPTISVDSRDNKAKFPQIVGLDIARLLGTQITTTSSKHKSLCRKSRSHWCDKIAP